MGHSAVSMGWLADSLVWWFSTAVIKQTDSNGPFQTDKTTFDAEDTVLVTLLGQ